MPISGFVAQNIPAMIDYLGGVFTVPDDFTSSRTVLPMVHPCIVS